MSLPSIDSRPPGWLSSASNASMASRSLLGWSLLRRTRSRPPVAGATKAVTSANGTGQSPSITTAWEKSCMRLVWKNASGASLVPGKAYRAAVCAPAAR